MEKLDAEVLDGDPCHLGEGPTYDPVSRTAWWFDILGRKLFEMRWSDRSVRTHDLPFMASQLCFVDDRTQLLATDRGLTLRDVSSGALTHHLDLEPDGTRTRSNDGRVHPSGALWIGTMGLHAERELGSIYWYRDGELRRLYGQITIPNAVCFSPDGSIGYFADTDRGTVHQVALDPQTGLPTGQPSIFIEADASAGGPDGAVVDAQGRFWNARWGAGRVDVHSPDGTRIRSIAVPAKQPSCPAFVGPDLDRLLVTTAFEGMDDDARNSDPKAGQTFLLDVGAKGIAEPRVRIKS